MSEARKQFLIAVETFIARNGVTRCRPGKNRSFARYLRSSSKAYAIRREIGKAKTGASPRRPAGNLDLER